MQQRASLHILFVFLFSLLQLVSFSTPSSVTECKESKMSQQQVLQFPDKTSLSKAVGEQVATLAKLVTPGEKFTIALSGGSLPTLLAAGLLEHAESIDFSSWHVFFADERHVPHDHDDSNYKASLQEFLAKVPVPADQIYGNNAGVTVQEAAVEYENKLIEVFDKKDENGIPQFDLILLGMGPDGHTCSLFPGHPLLQEFKSLVAPITDSPKPPPERITLTYPVLNAASNVFFLAAGAGKAEVLPKVVVSLEEAETMGEDALPAARVRPTQGKLVWFVDTAAASNL